MLSKLDVCHILVQQFLSIPFKSQLSLFKKNSRQKMCRIKGGQETKFFCRKSFIDLAEV
jgi:hypothetical protein